MSQAGAADEASLVGGLTIERRDAVAGAVVVVIALAVGYVSSQFYGLTLNGQPGSGFFPFVVSGVLLVLGVALTVMSLLRPRDQQRPIDRDHQLFRRPRVLLFYFAVFLASVVLLEPVGFIITIAVVLTVLCKAIGGERVTLLSAGVYGVSLSLVSYILFARVLGIALPEGVIPL